MPTVSRITPCLWFDSDAEPAAQFYTSVFKNSRITTITRYGKAGFEIHQRAEGSVMTVLFELDGQQVTALNGGPHFKFSEEAGHRGSEKGIRGIADSAPIGRIDGDVSFA